MACIVEDYHFSDLFLVPKGNNLWVSPSVSLSSPVGYTTVFVRVELLPAHWLTQDHN
jgi:hypothetical protein